MAGTSRLSDVARHVIQPDGVVDTDWYDVDETCDRLGWRFDRWQDGLGRLILGTRSDGLYASDAVVVSIPRQVGKTYLMGAIIFALCLLRPGLTVIWTAHRTKTAKETFASMLGMAERLSVAPHVKQIVRARGDEAVLFENDSRVLFGAREQGFGRGFAGVDILVFDEAQILTESAMEDMIAAQNVAPNPLTILTGTPPRPRDPGEVFTMLRREALDGESSGTLYVEISGERGADPMDREHWRKANPSFPHRTSERAVLRMRKHLSLDSFQREALGIWDAESTTRPITPAVWAALAKPHLLELRPADVVPVFFVHVAPESAAAAIAVAYPTEEGRPFVELADYRTGTSWLVERCVELDASHPGATWAVEAAGAVGSLLPALEDEGIVPEEFSARGMGQACAHVQQLVADRAVWHSGDAAFAIAVQGAEVRPVGEGLWVFSPRKSSVDVSPIMAAAGALWALEQFDANYDVLDSVSGG